METKFNDGSEKVYHVASQDEDEVNKNSTHSGPASSIRDGSEKVYHDVEDDILNSIHSVQPTIGDS